MGGMASGVGLIPEQNWENPDLPASPFGTDPTTASIGFVNGGPAGSAAPLDWSAGAFVRLARRSRSGQLLDRPASTYSRYVRTRRVTTPFTVTSAGRPERDRRLARDRQRHVGSGNTVYVAATNTDNTFTTSTASADVTRAGTCSLQVPVDGGTTVLTTVAVSPTGATAHDQRTVVFDFVPGTLLLDATDPNGDDNGPGNYAYPTSSNFKPVRSTCRTSRSGTPAPTSSSACRRAT